MITQYILDSKGRPKLEPNLMRWAKWFGNSAAQRIAGSTVIGKARVSTVFLGLDHNWGSGPPILWETMVFGGEHNDYQERCPGTRKDAQRMHRRVVRMVKKGQK